MPYGYFKIISTKERQTMTDSTNKRHPLTINTILLILVGFFATWGEGMQHVISKASLIYPAFVAIYIVYNFNSFKSIVRSQQIVPKEFKALYLFITIHTVLYLLFNYQTIGFGTESGDVNDAGFAYGKTENGIVIVRYFMFLIFSLYLAVDLRSDDKLRKFSFAYITGFIFTIIGGAYNNYANDLMRFSGGLKDPNAMAFDALFALIISVYLFNSNLSKTVKVYVVFSIIIDLLAIFLSFSRGAYLALVIWSLLYFVRKGLIKNFMRIAMGVALFVIIGSIATNKMGVDVETLQERFSIQEMRENKGANRGYIWEAYLSNADKYFITGMGIGNSPKVMKGNKQGVAENYETHNLYLQFFAEFGIIGLLLYLRYWKGYMKQYRITRGNEFVLITMGGVMIIVTFFLNIDKGRTFWIVLAILNMIWVHNNYLYISKKNEDIQNRKKISYRFDTMLCIHMLCIIGTECLLL